MDDRSQASDSEANQHADDTEYPPLDEETLAWIADETWLEYDIRETEDMDREGDERAPNEMRDHE